MSDAAATPPLGIYVDTCAVLDIVRLPMRSRVPTRELAGVRTVLNAVADGRALLRISDVVPKEFERHREGVAAEVQRYLRRLHDDSAVVHDCAQHLSVGGIDWKVDPEGLGALLLEHAGEVISKSAVLKTTDQDRLDAMERQVESLRPGRKGKDCIADCMIATSVMRTAREHRLRSVFLSSNVRDYSEDEKTARIHPDLKPAFDELAISFVTTWEWAARHISGPVTKASTVGASAGG
jgi:hypothetical protein